MSIENYQKLLINKSRKYQIKKIRSDKTVSPEELSPSDDVEGLISEQEDPVAIQRDPTAHGLNAEYFEA